MRLTQSGGGCLETVLGTIITVGMKGPFVREVSIKPAAAIEPNPAESDHVLVSGRDPAGFQRKADKQSGRACIFPLAHTAQPADGAVGRSWPRF